MTALTATVLIGFAGVAVDIGSWEVSKHQMQWAADDAAFAAATAHASGSTAGVARTTARGVAAQAGFADGQGGVGIAVNNPPTAGTNTTNSYAWEVVVTKPQDTWFTNFFLSSQPVARARAVALEKIAGDFCVLALDPSSNSSLSVQGSSQLLATQCNIQVNSTSNSAASWSGGGAIEANILAIAGGYSGSPAQVTATIDTAAPTIADPYAGVAVPSFSGCSGGTSRTANGVVTLQPGVYCNGLTINNSAVVTMAPGTYILDRGDLRINGGATVTGVDVTIVLTSSTGSNYATLTINGSATVNLTAASSGSLSGLLVFQDRNAPRSITNALSGGSGQMLIGALYFPNTQVSYSGGVLSNTPIAMCTQLIARTISFTGTSGFQTNCKSIGTAEITGQRNVVVE